MVAGRRFWGHNEERTTKHQTGCGGDLGIEAVKEDSLRAGEARSLDAGIDPRRQVDQQDHGEAEQAEGKDDSPQAPPPPVMEHDEGEGSGQQRHRNQQVGVGLASGLGADRGRRCGR